MTVGKSVRRIRRSVAQWLGAKPVSTDFEILKGPYPVGMHAGWQNGDLPNRQWTAFAPILDQMRSGSYRKDFIALANAVRCTAMNNPTIIEVGCGSGWNSEVLKRLLSITPSYVGTDYSFGMVKLGQAHYSNVPFLVSDAVDLPFQDAACDILLSGTSLMHIPEYQKAIAESRRVSRHFAIFHTVTVHFHRDTTLLKKRAYGEWVPEIVFNEGHLIEIFAQAGFALEKTFASIPYDLVDVTGEHSVTKTYVCRAI